MRADEVKWPKNLEMERLILGAAILHQSPEFWLEITDKLQATDFAVPSHRAIFAAIDSLVNRGASPDAFALRDELERTGCLDVAGGMSTLAGLYEGVPRLFDLKTEIERVKDLSMKRQMMKFGQWLIDTAASDDDFYEQVLANAEDKLTALTASRDAGDLVDSATAIQSTIAQLVQGWDNPDSIPGLITGFPDLDNLLHGLRPGRQHLLAARPGEGKTTLALNVAHQGVSNPRNAGAVGLVVSLEMSVEELNIRAISTATRIDSDRILTGKLSKEEKSEIIAAAELLAKLNIHYIKPGGALMVSSLRARAQRVMRQQKRLDFIVVDFLQLLEGKRKETRNVEVGEISRGLKLLSIALNVPILTLSQLSRDIEKRGGEPQLSDLRDSGSLEQDADVVMFLYDSIGADAPDHPQRQLLIKKHRGGKPGVVELLWFKEQSRFTCATRG